MKKVLFLNIILLICFCFDSILKASGFPLVTMQKNLVEELKVLVCQSTQDSSKIEDSLDRLQSACLLISKREGQDGYALELQRCMDEVGVEYDIDDQGLIVFL